MAKFQPLKKASWLLTPAEMTPRHTPCQRAPLDRTGRVSVNQCLVWGHHPQWPQSSPNCVPLGTPHFQWLPTGQTRALGDPVSAYQSILSSVYPLLHPLSPALHALHISALLHQSGMPFPTFPALSSVKSELKCHFLLGPCPEGPRNWLLPLQLHTSLSLHGVGRMSKHLRGGLHTVCTAVPGWHLVGAERVCV